MIYEHRAYYVLPGRKKALLDRFANHTMALFDRHGIQVLGFWETEIGDSTEVIYICAYPSIEHRMKAWAAFRADPEWQAAAKKSEEDGPIVARVESRILTPTTFSPLQ
jgi:hypothetical protein